MNPHDPVPDPGDSWTEATSALVLAIVVLACGLLARWAVARLGDGAVPWP